MQNVIQNVLLGISLAAPVGPGSVTIIKSGLRGGFLSAWKVAWGVIAADATHLLIVFFGLASVMTNAFVKTALLIVGTGVLLYLGFQTIRDARRPPTIEGPLLQKYNNLFAEGYLVNVTNAMAIVWWLGMFGSVIAGFGEETSKIAAFFSCFAIVLGALIWHTGLSLASHFGKKAFHPVLLRYISFASGIVLCGFALRLGYKVVLAIAPQ